MVGLVIAFLLSVFNIGLEEIMQVEKSIWIIGCLVMAAVLMVISHFLSLKIYTKNILEIVILSQNIYAEEMLTCKQYK